ncbi:MAG: hypothetical protein NC124_02375 [Clostridium sp.]|nr:hypothetical protein [Clostridium sp.]
MKKNRLTKIKLDEVSLVDRGANQEAFVVLHKRDTMEENQEINTNDADVKKNEFTEALAVAESLNDMWKLQDALREAITEIIDSDDSDKAARVSGVVDSYAAAIKGKITAALSKADADATLVGDLQKRLAFVESLNDEQKKYFMELDEVAKKDLIENEKGAEEITKRLSEDEVVEVDGAEIRKSKVGEAAFAIVSKAVADKAAAEEAYREEVAKREHEECIAKAKELLDGYACEDEVLEKAYKAYSEMSEENRASFDIIFKIGSTALAGLKEQVSNPTAVAKELSDQEKVEALIQKQTKD